MNDETKIKLQAYLDGELSGRDKASISSLLDSDAGAKEHFAELQFVKTAMRGNELDTKVPETREFYWSKIQREIERSASEPVERAVFAWWKPIYARIAGGIAATCALLMVSFIAFNNGASTQFVPGELEGTGEEMGAITFRSDAERMTVVYLFDREDTGMVDSTID